MINFLTDASMHPNHLFSFSLPCQRSNNETITAYYIQYTTYSVLCSNHCKVLYIANYYIPHMLHGIYQIMDNVYSVLRSIYYILCVEHAHMRI